MSTLILELIGLHFVNNNSVTYFDSFGVEHILKEIKAFIGHSLSITKNIFRTKAYDLVVDFFYIFLMDLLILCLKERP